ncbi:condensation domain-containing protein [Streptomyces sp. 1331.2]|uniref:condensation domain-containing protein n=1 Tax=Streptomyces sp. 1331.2 TaxID=1938835 RepID=UPI000BD9081A|nr:condensation domain-containing protein [Streptomyces sp. 1331.2]SOB85474.1 Condensation domain-containing protein [Streptomyces sp. 1331.2]
MTTRHPLEIAFSSGRAGSGPATWGQQAIWDAVRRLPPADAPRYNITTAAPLDPGLPLPVLLAALERLLHRHDSLHTRLLPPDDDGGPLRQVVDPEGTLGIDVRTAGERDAPAELGARLHEELAAQPFDTAAQWPIRVGLVVADDLVRHISLVLSHTAVDGSGMSRLVADLTALCLDSSPQASAELRRPSQQPLEEAGFQTSERGARRDAAARRQVLRKLRQGPPRLFPPASDPSAPFPNAVLRSPALARAVERVAAAHRVSTGSVLLAATAAMTARLAGTTEAVLNVVVNNRFLPELADAVSVVAGDGLFHLPDATGEFGEVVRRTHAAAIGTYRHAYFDRLALATEIERLTAEGVPLADRSCVFNDTRDLLPAAPDPGNDRTTLSWPVEFEPRPGLTYALDALQSPEAISLAMTANPAVLPRPAMERFLYGIEELVLTEADTGAGKPGTEAGVAPPR